MATALTRHTHPPPPPPPLCLCRYHTFLELLPGLSHLSGHPDGQPGPLPEDFANHIKFADYSCGAMKINLAVDSLPNFACMPNTSDGKPGPQHRGTHRLRRPPPLPSFATPPTHRSRPLRASA